MPSNIPRPSTPKLSICIATFNRATFIHTTLESILVQLTDDCEVVVLDGGSTDKTEEVISEYARHFDRLRYVKQDTNNGIDRDYDRVVELAKGEYCWLMTDDDLLNPGAVTAVLEALRRDLSLIIVNAELRDSSLSKILQRRWLAFEEDRIYGPEELDRLFADVCGRISYIGGIVIKRTIWLTRDRARYYGSLLIHIGIIFQAQLPGETFVIAEPFISYRMGNAHTFSAKVFEIVMFRGPSLVWSLALSDWAKSQLCSAEPWRDPNALLMWRARGAYSLTQYRQWIRPQLRSVREILTPLSIAVVPGMLLNAIFVFYYTVTGRSCGVLSAEAFLQELSDSRFHFRNLRFFKRES